MPRLPGDLRSHRHPQYDSGDEQEDVEESKSEEIFTTDEEDDYLSSSEGDDVDESDLDDRN